MAGNFPGAGNAVPQVVTNVETLVSGVSVPSGTRLAVILGEGHRNETLVSSAVGGGSDGFNSSYNSTSGSDGRHFLLGRGVVSVAPVVQNRTRLFKNGVELTVLEGTIDGTFDNRFQAKVDRTNGQIELQPAYLIDQGGESYLASSNNTGDGTISSLTLLDSNAPAETWTIRCSSIRRDGYGNPVDGYARFIARGSISGTLLDGYGNNVIWISDGTSNDNSILSFSISEGLTPFREGDSFTVRVGGGPLLENDSLTAHYISIADLDDPEFFTDINKLAAKHGSPSLSNRLSLGARLAFANGAPGVFALGTAPALPRRLSYTLVNSANGESDIEELTFALPLNVIPDADSNINFFVTDATTGVETQIVPNKVDFYDSTITSNHAGFVFGSEDFSYTVVLDSSVQKSGSDGVITSVTGTTGTISSASVNFTSADTAATRQVVIVNAANANNNGTFTVASISNGVLTLNNPSGFVNETGIEFQVIDTSETSAKILFTDDLALSAGESLRATIVDTKDADFFDAGWASAYTAAETIDVDMVIPLPSQTISAIFQAGKVHVEKMSRIKQNRERILMIGAIQGLTPDNVIGTNPAAVEDIGILEGIQGDDASEILAGNDEDLTNYGVQDGFGGSFRVVYFYPDQIVLQIGADRVFADGFFIAAAAAGYFSGSNLINEPLTNKTLTGFTILRDKLYSPIVVENISAAGISLLQPVSGGGRVVWGKTTTISQVAEEEEISIIFIRDRIAKSMRAAFRPYIGRAETPTMDSTLFSVATSMMSSFISQRLITEYANLTVERDSVESRQFNVGVIAQPVYGVNWIYIPIGIGRIN